MNDAAPQPSHRPVLLAEVRAAGVGARRAVDATLGHGGHAEALLSLGAEVFGIDRDPEALAIARARLGPEAPIQYLLGRFFDDDTLGAIAAFAPDFILLDLGVSTRQLDDDARGFTFRPGAPLDMRMSGDGETAADLLAGSSGEELAHVFHAYGDEPRARRLAAEIVRRRSTTPFVTSDDLVKAIRGALGPRTGAPEFARLFQAVRIAVNEELDGLERALPMLRDALTPGGWLAVICYHSGEDRLVKHAFRDWARACICPPELPVCGCRGRALGTVEPRRAIVPSDEEIAENPRARSAKLRLFQVADAA